MTNFQFPLVTGGAGFIGSNLVNKLSEMSEVIKVYCVDLPNSPRFEQLKLNPKIAIIEADLNDPKSMNLLPKDASVVFALAALNGTSRFYTQPWTVLKGSLVPTLHTIQFYSKIAPILYASSSEVYATTVESQLGQVPTSESVNPSLGDIHNPRWSYAGAKLLGEVALNSAAVEFGAIGAIVRYHNVYGPNMGLDHFIPDFIARVKIGKKEIIGGSNTRSFLHISDALDGTIAAAKVASNSIPLYHLGTSCEVTIKDAAIQILEIMDESPDDLIISPAPSGSVSRRCPDVSKALNELGWSAKISFQTGIKHYLAENNFS